MWEYIGEEQISCPCPGKKTIHTYNVYQRGDYKAFYLNNELSFGQYYTNGNWVKTQRGFVIRAGAPRLLE